MENQTPTPKWLSRENLQVIREFFAWLLVIYFVYQNKELDKEKTEILKAQIEVLNRTKETESKQLQIIDKIINEKAVKNNDSPKSIPDNNRE